LDQSLPKIGRFTSNQYVKRKNPARSSDKKFIVMPRDTSIQSFRSDFQGSEEEGDHELQFLQKEILEKQNLISDLKNRDKPIL
jgi:hypothetical protein